MSRTRNFDLETAVDQAMYEFWRKGYEGTSLSDLTRAMGINRPSLYAAFENKEGLFRRVVERYLANLGGRVRAALEAPTAREAVEQLLQIYCDVPSEDAKRPAGCLLVHGALACSDASRSIRSELAGHRHASEAALRERLRRAKAEGELASDENVSDLSRYIWTVCNGLSVQASGGATRAELRRVAARALRAWPGAAEARG